MVKINNAHIKQTFKATTDQSWQDFSDISYAHFRKPSNNVLMGYKFAGNEGGLTELTCEPEWKKAIIRTKQKNCGWTHTCSHNGSQESGQ